MRLKTWWNFLERAPRRCHLQSSSQSLFVLLKRTGWVNAHTHTHTVSGELNWREAFKQHENRVHTETGPKTAQLHTKRGCHVYLMCICCFVCVCVCSWRRRRMSRGGVKSRCYWRNWSRRSNRRRKRPRWDSELWPVTGETDAAVWARRIRRRQLR